MASLRSVIIALTATQLIQCTAPISLEDTPTLQNNIEQVVEKKKFKHNLIVNLPFFKLGLYEGSNLVEEFDITVGKPSTKTPIGDYEIHDILNWAQFYAGTWMPFIPMDTGGYGLHGYHTQYSMGHALSKGCVRLFKEDANHIKALISPGTPFNVTYDTIVIKDDTLNIATDIYSLGTNKYSLVFNELRDSGISITQIDVRQLNNVVGKADENRRIYLAAINELYETIIRPLPDKVYFNILDEYPKMQDYLDIMKSHRLIQVPIDDLIRH